MNTWSNAVVLALAGMSPIGSMALAADLPSTPQPLPPLALEDSWKFQATFYGWATAINGKVGIRGLPPDIVNVTFADILKNLNGAVMGSFYASNGKWMILIDVVWAKLSDHVDVGPFGGQVKFEQQQAIISGVVGYRLPIGPDNIDISATAGARYNYLDAKLDFLPGILPIEKNREGTKSWVDPTISRPFLLARPRWEPV